MPESSCWSQNLFYYIRNNDIPVQKRCVLSQRPCIHTCTRSVNLSSKGNQLIRVTTHYSFDITHALFVFVTHQELQLFNQIKTR